MDADFAKAVQALALENADLRTKVYEVLDEERQVKATLISKTLHSIADLLHWLSEDLIYASEPGKIGQEAAEVLIKMFELGIFKDWLYRQDNFTILEFELLRGEVEEFHFAAQFNDESQKSILLGPSNWRLRSNWILRLIPAEAESEPIPEESKDYELSDDGLTLFYDGKSKKLTTNSASLIKVLLEHYKTKTHFVHEACLQEECGFESAVRHVVRDCGLQEIVIKEIGKPGKRGNGYWGLAILGKKT
jgi:hypothetical protein